MRLIYMQQEAAIREATVEPSGWRCRKNRLTEPWSANSWTQPRTSASRRTRVFPGSLFPARRTVMVKSCTSNDRHSTGLIVEAALAYSPQISEGVLSVYGIITWPRGAHHLRSARSSAQVKVDQWWRWHHGAL